MPIYRTDEQRARVLDGRRCGFETRCAEGARPIRSHVDTRENMTPGAKYFDWELRGVPAPAGARPARSRQAAGRARPPGHAREAAGSARPSCREWRPTSSRRFSATCSPRHASAARRNSIRGPITYDRFREVMDGRRGVRVRGLVRVRGVRGGDQGRDQGDDPRLAGSRVPLDSRLRARVSSAASRATAEALWAKAY